MARVSNRISTLLFSIMTIQVLFLILSVLSVLFSKISVTLTEITQLQRVQNHSNERGILSLSLVYGKARGIMSLSPYSLTLQQTRLPVLFHWHRTLNLTDHSVYFTISTFDGEFICERFIYFQFLLLTGNLFANNLSFQSTPASDRGFICKAFFLWQNVDTYLKVQSCSKD